MGSIEGELAGLSERHAITAVDLLGREAVEALVMVPLVLPGDELAAPGARVEAVAEAPGKAWLVLQGLEAGFAKRVVVANPWPTAGCFDAEGGQQRVEAARAHGRAAIVVQDQLPGRHAIGRSVPWGASACKHSLGRGKVRWADAYVGSRTISGS